MSTKKIAQQDEERHRLAVDKAERKIISDSWSTLKDVTSEDAAGIFLRILEQFEEGKNMSQIRFNR